MKPTECFDITGGRVPNESAGYGRPQTGWGCGEQEANPRHAASRGNASAVRAPCCDARACFDCIAPLTEAVLAMLLLALGWPLVAKLCFDRTSVQPRAKLAHLCKSNVIDSRVERISFWVSRPSQTVALPPQVKPNEARRETLRLRAKAACR